MKKSDLKKLIREELNILKEAEEVTPPEKGSDKKQITIPSTLKTLITKLNPDINIQPLSMALGKISQKKENLLSLKEKEVLSDVFISLMKNEDSNLGLKFLNIFKQIK